ncbi:MAG: sodium:calcium antiporter [Chloroflexi bacterium]|nr:sodium:calcium antiporter [Chloroflexota bacterium]
MIDSILNYLTSGHIVWISFTLSAAAIVYSAMALARYGDIIAARTGAGGMLIGVLLLAGVTSLPELLTSINAVNINQPNIAAGNLLGSSAVNMVILALLGILSQRRGGMRDITYSHILSGSLATFMGTLVLLFIASNSVLERIGFNVGWIGIDSLLIISVYIYAIYIIQKSEADAISTEMSAEELADIPSLRHGVIGFTLAALALVIVTPVMVRGSEVIAEITGLGTSFIGSTLVAFVTSLPELVTTVSAAKIGAYEMAVGNLFGSNMFNMFGVGMTDIFYTRGRIFDVIDPSFVVIGMVGVMMTSFALVGNVSSAKWTNKLPIDSILMFLIYLGGMYLLYIM